MSSASSCAKVTAAVTECCELLRDSIESATSDCEKEKLQERLAKMSAIRPSFVLWR
eukprot:gene4100-5235_t